jgi:hypothetical protein
MLITLVAEESPSYATFIGMLFVLIGSCRRWTVLLEHYNEGNGNKPGKEHYSCMVGLLCRAVGLDEAEQIHIE